MNCFPLCNILLSNSPLPKVTSTNKRWIYLRISNTDIQLLMWLSPSNPQASSLSIRHSYYHSLCSMPVSWKNRIIHGTSEGPSLTSQLRNILLWFNLLVGAPPDHSRGETSGRVWGAAPPPPMTEILSSNIFGSLYVSQAILEKFICVALSLLLFAPAKYYAVYRK